jgi:predicted dehydrogenase
MTNKILNWGLLSTARINNALIPPLRASKRNKLLAVASRMQEAADAYAKEKEIPRAHGSYDALHAEWTIRAVEAGKHVLCEKPLALSVEEVDAIQTATRKHGRVVAEAFMYRHHPQTLQVQEIVKSGSLGIVKLIRGSFSFLLTREGDVRTKLEWGGGSIWDIGCYPISYARSVLGENPLEVFGWQVPGRTGIDETFVGQMKFSNHALMQFHSSFAIPYQTFMEIVGSEGSLNVPMPFQPKENEKIYLTRNGNTDTIKIKGQELYIGEVEDMADAILLGKEPRISLEDSRGNVMTITALLESARTGKLISCR